MSETTPGRMEKWIVDNRHVLQDRAGLYGDLLQAGRGSDGIIADLVAAADSLVGLLAVDDLRLMVRVIGGVSEAAERYMERIDRIAVAQEATRTALARATEGA